MTVINEANDKFDTKTLINKIIQNYPNRYYQDPCNHKQEFIDLMSEKISDLYNCDDDELKYQILCEKRFKNILNKILTLTIIWSQKIDLIEKLRKCTDKKCYLNINEIEDIILDEYHSNIDKIINKYE